MCIALPQVGCNKAHVQNWIKDNQAESDQIAAADKIVTPRNFFGNKNTPATIRFDVTIGKNQKAGERR